MPSETKALWRTRTGDLVGVGDRVALGFGRGSTGQIQSGTDEGRVQVKLLTGPGTGELQTIDVGDMLFPLSATQ